MMTHVLAPPPAPSTATGGPVRSAMLGGVADDGESIIVGSRVLYAHYRDADGIERRVSTGCRDEQAARQVLANLLAEAEKIKAGILTREEMEAS